MALPKLKSLTIKIDHLRVIYTLQKAFDFDFIVEFEAAVSVFENLHNVEIMTCFNYI